ncbi:MAG: hypothetical protein DELT_01313 [Desulfovibrio sp.]
MRPAEKAVVNLKNNERREKGVERIMFISREP